MRSVAVTEGDKLEARIRFGLSVDGYGTGELVAAMRDVDDATVEGLVSEYEDAYELVPALGRDGERRESLHEAARIEAGLRSFLEREGPRLSRTRSRTSPTFRSSPVSPSSG